MNLRSHLVPRPNASSPLNYKALPMANTSQAPDLEGLPREMHSIAEQIRIMNENNARLIQHLTTNNPHPLLQYLFLKFNNIATLNVWAMINP